MLKKIIQVSSLVCVLAAASWIPANAASEEDAAAPAGSFTSNMSVPATGLDGAYRRWRHERFAMRFDGVSARERAARHDGDGQR